MRETKEREKEMKNKRVVKHKREKRKINGKLKPSSKKTPVLDS